MRVHSNRRGGGHIFMIYWVCVCGAGRGGVEYQ